APTSTAPTPRPRCCRPPEPGSPAPAAGRSVVVEVGPPRLARLAGVGVDPVGDADLVLGLVQALALDEVVGGLALHVLLGLAQGGEGPVFAPACLVLPVEAVGALDAAVGVVRGGRVWRIGFHAGLLRPGVPGFTAN